MDREENIDVLFEKLKEMLDERRYRDLKDALSEMNEVDIAEFLSGLENNEQTVIAYRSLGKELAADVFSNLDPDIQESIINAITDKELQEF